MPISGVIDMGVNSNHSVPLQKIARTILAQYA